MRRETAKRISDSIRSSDTVSRLGGDEFTVILPELGGTLRIDEVTQAILQAIQQPFAFDADPIYLTASIGISLYPNDASDSDTLFKNADQAMYQAKNLGRNGYSYFVVSMQEAAQKRQALIRDLRNAIASNQLIVYYQPIVELATGSITKAEALLRWQRPGMGMVSPGTFIPVAEETGLIHEIGNWVFQESARQAKNWQERYGIQISINKSPRQFMGGTTIQNWIAYLREIDLSPDSIVIEITESLLLENSEEVIKKLNHFQENGVQISLDDFGTGYSAMSYLKKYKIDFLKIDQSFVRDMVSDTGDQAIIEAIILIAHKLGILVIAEGVETVEQYSMLRFAGCDFAQGYYFAKPMPAADFEAYIQSHYEAKQ